MKENQIESCQKRLLVKTYEWHKKAARTDLIKKKTWRVALKIDPCVGHKIILSWPLMKLEIYENLNLTFG